MAGPNFLSMRAGELRHSVAIQSSTESRDSYDVDYSWATDATVRASITPLSGDETIVADQEQSTATHKIIIRNFAGLTPNHRLLFGTRVFNIVSMLNTDERNRRMQLMCTEDV